MRHRVTAADLSGCWVDGSRLSHAFVLDCCRNRDRTIREHYREVAICVLLEVRQIASEAYRDHVNAPPRRLLPGGVVASSPDPKREQAFRQWDALVNRYWDAIRREVATRPPSEQEATR